MKKEISQCYHNLYQWMIDKNIEKLEEVLDDDFTLTHLTGRVQNKKQFLEAIKNETLNLYSVIHDELQIKIKKTILLIGKSRIRADVDGGEVHIWRLRQDITLKKKNGMWIILSAKTSLYE